MSVSTRTTYSRLTTMEATDKQFEVFRVLYPIFKDEIFKRREQMMRLTGFSSTLLLLTLIVILPLPIWKGTPPATGWLVISGVGLFSGLFAYFILQHAERHRMAKQQLIELERAIGLYENGWQIHGESLFPKNWQTDWTKDRSVSTYLTILTGLTVLVMCAILIQM